MSVEQRRSEPLLGSKEVWKSERFVWFLGTLKEGRPCCPPKSNFPGTRSRIAITQKVDVLGRTRATLIRSSSLQPWLRGLGNLLKPYRAGDRSL